MEQALAEPLQLFTFTKKNGTEAESTLITLNTDVIDNIISKVEDRPICVISVCGPSRMGKSFLLGYFIRCLEALEQNEEDWMGWNNQSKPLDGFKFKNGTKPETQGIYVWSHPFIIQTEDNGEVAVFLVDTQGTYDEFTNQKDMSAIVGLSMLASSVFVFNFFTNLQEDVLKDLQTYIQYGNMAQNNLEDSAYAFQKLCFLIRDWNNPGEFPYGGKGGRLFLKEKLKVKENQPKEAKFVRKSIQKCFEELDCFLLPKIGERAILPDFKGSVEELSESFAKQIEKFINGLIDPDCLPIKKIMGNPFTAVDYKAFLQSYVDIYNSNEIPSADMMWNATSQMFSQNLFEKALQIFKLSIKNNTPDCGYLSAQELHSLFSKAKTQAVDHFQKQNKFCTDEIKTEFEQKLQNQIQEELSFIEQQNAINRTKLVETAISNATTTFKDIFDQKITFSEEELTVFYEDSYIEDAYDLAQRTARQQLLEKIPNEDKEELKKILKSLDQILEGQYTTARNRNDAQIKKAEKEIKSLTSTLLDNHIKTLQDFFEREKFVNNDEIFLEFNKLEQDKTANLFAKASKPGNEEFYKTFKEDLQKDMQAGFAKLHTDHNAHINKITIEIEKIISKKISSLESQLNKACNRSPTLEQLDKFYQKEIDNIKQKFHSEIKIPSDSALCTLYTDSLLQKAKQMYDSCKTGAAQLTAGNDAMDFYKQQMKDWINDNKGIISNNDLKAKHDEFCQKSIIKFKSHKKELELFDPSKILQDLDDFFAKEFFKYEEDVQNKNKVLLSDAAKLQSGCLKGYESAVEEHIEKIKSTAALASFHSAVRDASVQQFKELCPIKNSGYISEQSAVLFQDIENKYKAYEARLKLQLTENELRMKGVFLEAHELYHDEMEKKSKNDNFVTYETLLKNHKTTKAYVFQKCISKTLDLSETQKAKLNDYLENEFLIWREKNRLNSQEQTKQPAIGIDLGTTYCCVAVYYQGKVHLIPNQRSGGELTTPSYIAFDKSNTETFGATAKDSAFRNPENTIFDVKRIIGRDFEDPVLQKDIKFWPFTVEKHENVPKILVNGQYLYPEQISGKFLVHLRKMAEEYLQLTPGSIKKAVITVPAYFNDGQRQATRDAGELAGLDVLKILNEPTAAAMAYSLERTKSDSKNILIYDLGGGTFDISVLKMTGTKSAVLGVGGDTHLGGEDFDRNLMEYCAAQFLQQSGLDLLRGKDSQNAQERHESRRSLRRLQAVCEKAKRDLTAGRIAEISADALRNGRDFNIRISRTKFEELNENYFSRTIAIVDETLKKVGLLKDNIDDVVLVGGSSRIPRVQELLTEYFDGKILNKSIHPDHAVGYGAAVQAALLNGGPSSERFLDIEIDDVIPMTIGVKVVTGNLAVFLPKNTKYPVKVHKVHTTARDNQTSVEFCVYQGENIDVATANQLLGKFTIEGIPPKPEGEEKFDVTMEIDSGGILHVTAVSKSTKAKNGIVVRENKQRMSEDDKRRALFK